MRNSGFSDESHAIKCLTDEEKLNCSYTEAAFKKTCVSLSVKYSAKYIAM